MRLRPVAAALLVLLATVPPAHPAPGPNPRAPLATVADVLSVSMADDGTLLATTDDPGSSIAAPNAPGPAVDTWFLWRPDGTAIVSGSGDLPNCSTRVQDLCDSPVVAGAMAHNGARFAIGANLAPSVTDSAQSVLAVGTPSGGIQARRALEAPIVALATNRTGASVAVLQRVPSLTGAATTAVEWFDVAGTTFTNAMSRQSAPGVPTALSMSADGTRVAVASDKVYVYRRDASLPVSLGTGTPTSVSLAGSGAHGLLWGTTAGDVGYATDASASPRYTGSLGSAVNTVAISRDGKWGAAGSQDGLVRILALRETGSPAGVVARDLTLPDAVRGLSWSPDGLYLVARTASQVRLILNDANHTTLWSHAPSRAPVGEAISATGDLVATGVGAGVVVYPAVRGIRADPVAEAMLPGASRTYPVTFRNDGNRPVNASLEVWAPIPWLAVLDRDNITVGVDGTAVVNVKVMAPAKQPPGKTRFYLNHTLSTGARGSVPIDITVPTRAVVLLEPVGPASLPIRGGETVTFAARVENLGNAPVTAHLEGTTTPERWRSSVEPRTLALGPDESGNVTVTLSAPEGIREGDAGYVELVLLERPEERIVFTATMGARFGASLAIDAFTVAEAGNVTPLEVTVRNLGNVPDSFRFEVVSVPEGWQGTFTPGNDTVRDVGANEGASVHLSLAVPADAPNGYRGKVVLRVTSLADPAATAEDDTLVGVVARGTDPPGGGAGIDPGALMVGGLAVLAVGGFAAAFLLLRRKGP